MGVLWGKLKISRFPFRLLLITGGSNYKTICDQPIFQDKKRFHSG